MMLGSVFNRHQASTSSEPSRVILRIMKVGKDIVPFSEFRGVGSPGLDIGLPGDIYIDLTPGLYGLYARYSESWSLWPGPKDVSTLLRHPIHNDRCLWCNDTIGWFHPRNVRIKPSETASEVIFERLRYQPTALDESKKRKRDALGGQGQSQSIRKLSTSSPSQNRTYPESPTDARLCLLSPMSKTPYSQPALEITPGPHSSTTPPIIQNSGYLTESPITDSHQSSIPAETGHTSTSKDPDPNGCSERNPQGYTTPKRIDLRTLKPFSKPPNRRAASFTGVYAESVLHSTGTEQSLPQHSFRLPPLSDAVSQSSTQDSEISRSVKDDDADHFTNANSNTMSSNSADVQNLPTKPISFNLSGEWLANQGDHVDNGPTLDIAIAELRKMKEAAEANTEHLQAANDKIRRLEAENAKLRRQLLSQSQCNLSSRDIPPMMTNMEIPPGADPDALDGARGEHLKQPQNVSQTQAGSAGSREIVRNVSSGSRPCPVYHPCKEDPEANPAPRRSTTPCTSPFLADTSGSTESAVRPVPPLESVAMEHRSINDIETDLPLPDNCISFESNTNNRPSVKEQIVDTKLCHAPLAPMSQMREIHRSVLFAKAGSFLICRICLGTKSGGIETVDQAFKIAEDSPELMQEHCEKEHPNDCEALMNMKDEELLDIVSMISSGC